MAFSIENFNDLNVQDATNPKICIDFLNNKCSNNHKTCISVHTKYNFLWQAFDNGQWHNFEDYHQEEVEAEFRKFYSNGLQLTSVDPTSGDELFDSDEAWYVDFDQMTVDVGGNQQNIRRLTTESSFNEDDNFASEFMWFFKNERNFWLLYGKGNRKGRGNQQTKTQRCTSSDEIEMMFSVNQQQTGTVQGPKYSYDIDFVGFVQINQDTNASRPIRRRPKAGPLLKGNGPASDYQISPMFFNKPTKAYKWQFLDEKNNWVDYGLVSSGNDPKCIVTSSSKDIETLYASDPKATIKIQSQTNTYDLDFQAMKQTNVESGVIRDVRRIPASTKMLPINPVVDFSSGNHISAIRVQQTNLGFFRSLRRIPASPKTQPMNPVVNYLNRFGNSNGTVEYEWFVRDVKGKWIKYGTPSTNNDSSYVVQETSSDIEAYFKANNGNPMTVRSQKFEYLLNFSDMTQENKDTGVRRPLLRRPKNSPVPLSTKARSKKLAYEWFFKENDGTWVKHGCKDLEGHHQKQNGTPFNFTTNGNSYVIDFGRMIQTNTSTSKVRELQRRKQMYSPSKNSSHSNSFDSIPTKQPTKVKLNSSDPEYVQCLQLIRANSPGFSPQEIYKIINPYFKQAFDIRKALLQSQNPSVAYQEKQLFHGTKPNNVEGILSDNIDWRLHGSNAGQNQGRGAYFSNSSALSLGYGQALFVCRVLVGLTAQGNSQIIKPPRDSSNRPVDTTVDNVNSPKIFVKYDFQEYYPEYYAV